MDDFRALIVASVLTVVGLCGFVFFCVTFGQVWSLHYQPTVSVRVDGKEVFRGSNACIDESSLGSATHVQINTGFLCLFPGPKYTSKNVEVKPL